MRIVVLTFLVGLSSTGAWGEDIPPGKYRGIYHVDRWGQHRLDFQYVSPELHDQLKDVVGRPVELNATQVHQQMNPGGSMITQVDGVKRLAEPVEIALGWLRPKEGPTEMLRQVLPGSTVRLKAKVTNRSEGDLVLDSDTFVLALDAHLPPSPSFGSHHVSYPSFPRPGQRTWSFCRDRLPLLAEDQELDISHPFVTQPKPRLENPPRLAPGRSLEWTITMAGWSPNEYELGVLYRAPPQRPDRLGRAPQPVEVSSNLLRLDVLADDSVARSGYASTTVELQLANERPPDPAKPVPLRVIFTNARGKRLRFGLFRGRDGPDLSRSLLCFDREGTLLLITPGEFKGTDDIRLEPGKTHEVLVEAPAGTVWARVAFYHPVSFTDIREDERMLEHEYFYSPTLRIGSAAGAAQPPATAVRPALDAIQSALLHHLLDEGSATALLELTHQLTVAEISQSIQSLPAALPAMTASGGSPAEVLHRTGSGYYNLPRLAVDSQGVAHLVFEQTRWERRGGQSRQVFHAERNNGQWSKPAPFLNSPLYISGMRLFVDTGDRLYLVGDGSRKTGTTSQGVDQTSWEVFLCHREPGQPWSEPESCITEHPEILHDADACFDAQGRLHLVWGHWQSNQKRERLRHRIRGPGGWGEEAELPGIARNLAHPRLRLLANQLHMFASGQTADYKQIGTYHCVLSDIGWSKPELLIDGTDFDHAMSLGSDRFLFGVHAGEHRGDRTFHLFRAGDDGELTQFTQFSIPGSPYTGRWSTMSVAWGPLDRPYGLAAQSGNIYLVRVAEGGGTESVWLSNSPAGGEVHQPQLFIAGDRYQATWIDRSRDESTVCFRDAPIPADGWLPVEQLLWRTRRGVGLTTADRGFLSDIVFREASALESDNLPRAVHRYFYVIANFQSVEAAWSRRRIMELEKNHLDVLKSELRALLQRHPEYLAGAVVPRRALNELTTRWDIEVK